MAAEFERLMALFAEAIEKHSPEEWGVFLDQACAGDRDLARQVRQLLDAHLQGGSLLDQAPAVADFAPTDCRTDVEAVGAMIGPYKLLQRIGEGGMGVVYMAEQVEPVARRVALKIIKPGMDSRQVIARFEAERQALAPMDHPNIARVLDAGTTDYGRPYFVMELVKGLSITQFCDQQHLTPRERLELFHPLCQAVQHAHQKGIIHRDLKPSNVLVACYDDRPVPKIIDFGVAKAISQRLTERTMFTQYGQIVGTIEYMSPEQAQFNQVDVDTRSDIYSLGVLLYELLTGETPFDKARLRTAAFDELLRIIREEEPPRPSTRLSSSESLPSIAANRRMEPGRLSMAVRGELDWIVMKALEKDRGRRYETASAFAADVHRYLNDDPVTACPPSTIYRLRKFVKRHRTSVTIAAVVVLGLLVAGISVNWTMRQQAEQRQRVATEVGVLLEDLRRQANDGKWAVALSTAERDRGVLAGWSGHSDLESQVQRHIQSLQLLRNLEQIRLQSAALVLDGSRNTTTIADAYAQAFCDADLDFEQLAPAEAVSRLIGRGEYAVPLTQAIDVYADDRRTAYGKADPVWRSLVTIATGIDSDPQRVRLRAAWGQPVTPELTSELRGMADADEMTRQPPTTLVLLSRALGRVQAVDAQQSLLRRAQRAYPNDYWINYDLADCYARAKDNREAIRFFTAALALLPNSPMALRNLGIVLSELNVQVHTPLKDQSKLDEALACFEKAISIDTSYGQAHAALGAFYMKQRDYSRAIPVLRTAISLVPDDAGAINNLANCILESPDVPETAVAEARELIRRSLNISDANYAAWHNLSEIAERTGEWRLAIEARQEKVKHNPIWAQDMLFLSIAHWQLGEKEQALDWYEKALTRLTERNQFNNEFVMPTLAKAEALMGQRRPGRASAPRDTIDESLAPAPAPELKSETVNSPPPE